MTEPIFADAGATVAGIRNSWAERIPRLRGIAAHLRANGLDADAKYLDNCAVEMAEGLKALSRQFDDLLEDTAVMDTHALANELRSDER